MLNTSRVLSHKHIHNLVKNKKILNVSSLDRIRACSLDVTIDSTIWKIKSVFLPGTHYSVMNMIEKFNLIEDRIDIHTRYVLAPKNIYLMSIKEHFYLPKNHYLISNPKSSIGRLDIFVRLLSDYSSLFDRTCTEYCGKLYIIVIPQTFFVSCQCGDSLSQVRIYKKSTFFSNTNKYSPLHIDLRDSSPVGYKARKTLYSINISKSRFYQKDSFWESIYDDYIIIQPGEFYIFSSCEFVSLHPSFSGYMPAFTYEIGEFRVHYAGFFDPGFGYHKNSPSKAVLEMRFYDFPFLIYHKQLIGFLMFHKILGRIDKDILYNTASIYQGQRLSLSKHFI